MTDDVWVCRRILDPGGQEGILLPNFVPIPPFPIVATNARTKHNSTIMMSRKYMLLAALVVAAACAHAGEGPKITHRVRDGDSQNTKSRKKIKS